MLDGDQAAVDAHLAEARRVYTPVGYRIVVLGYASFLAGGYPQYPIRLPSPP